LEAADIKSPPRSQPGRRDLIILAGFLLFLLIYFSGVLLQPGENCLGRPNGDARSQFYGWRAYGFGEIRNGRFPLWNPYEFLGMPFVASLQSGMFYPTNWLCAWGPLGRAVNLGIIVNLFLSALFTYLWCRRVRVGRAGSLIAAAAYTFGAPQFMRIYEGHWSFLCEMPWIPCVLLCVEVIVSGRRKLLAAAGGAAAVALELFAGNPQYALCGGVAAVLYFLVRAWQQRPSTGMSERGADRKYFLRVIGCFVGMYALGIVLAGVQLLPALEMLSVSARREPLSYPWISQYSFTPESLITIFSPDFFGSDINLEYWGRWNLWEMSAYVGVIAAGLAIVGVWKGRRRLVIPVSVIALILLLLALGKHTPVFWVLYRLVPGFGLFRVPARFLCPFSLFLALLAGVGTDVVLGIAGHGAEDTAGRRRLRAVTCGLAMLAVLFAVVGLGLTPNWEAAKGAWFRFMGWMLSVGPGERLYLPRGIVTSQFKVDAMQHAGLSLIRTALFLGALVALMAVAVRVKLKRSVVAAILIMLMVVDMWGFGRRYLQTFDPAQRGMTPGAVAVLKQVDQPFRIARAGCYTFPPCEGMTHGFACLEGVQPNVPVRFRDVFWSIQRGFEKKRQRTLYWIAHTSPFRMFNLRYLVQYASNPKAEIQGLSTIYDDGRIRIDELPNAWPRAWLVHRHTVIPDSDELLAVLPTFNYEQQVLFEQEPGVGVTLPGRPESPPRITRYEPSGVAIEVEAAADAFLILSDLHYPGWQATVDGKPVEMLRANYVMRAVHVPAGQHTVEFQYKPLSFQLGIAASALGCAIVAILLIFQRWTRQRNAARTG